MGISQTKDRGSPSEKAVEGLKNRVRALQGEVKEMMCVRETESQMYERELVVFAFKQAEWNRERKCLKEEVRRVRKLLEERRPCMVMEEEECGKDGVLQKIREEQARRDETVERWKQLYFAIKVELDDLIQRTHQDQERLCWRREEEDILLELKKEVTEKEERIELLKAKVASMEHQERKREREMDILRQSLKIMSHRKRSSSKRGSIQKL